MEIGRLIARESDTEVFTDGGVGTLITADE
jgi:hypothetical protein